MDLKPEIQAYIDRSVLCWLATSSEQNIPNVSPKEIFTYFKKNRILIANIASPQTKKNILSNENVCVSFIDILSQKGYKVIGKAQVLDSSHPEYLEMESELTKMTEGKFPFSTVFEITVEKIKPILSPRYVLYPNTTEKDQIANARKIYGL